MKTLFFILLLVSQSALSAPISSELTNLQGEKVVLDPAADRVLVNFWATWCPDCKSHMKKELPELAKHAGVAIVTINTEADTGRVKAFIEAEKLQFPVYQDPTKALRKSLKVFSVPHWAVYEKDSKGNWALKDSAGAFDFGRVKKALAIP